MNSITQLCKLTAMSTLIFPLGCGSDDNTQGPPLILDSPDDGVTDMPDQAADMSADCGALPERLQAFAGERLTVKAPQGALIVAAKWSAKNVWFEEQDQWWARAPYPTQEEQLELELDITCASGLVRHKLPVTISPMTWRHITWSVGSGPQAREHAPLWVGEDKALYMYGGYGFRPMQYQVLKDLWRMDRDTEAWRRLELDEASAPEGAGGRMVEAHGERYYIGGDNPQTNALNKNVFKLTIEGDQGRWELLPGGEFNTTLNAISWDEPRSRFVTTTGLTINDAGFEFLEGIQARPCCGEANWETTKPQGIAPSLRYGSFYGHDPQRQQMIVSMGAQYPTPSDQVNAAQDTWILELKTDTWRKLEASGDKPPGRRNGCGFYDAKTQRLFVSGGTANGRSVETGLYILHLDGEQARWERIEQPAAFRPRGSCSGSFDPDSAEAFLGFGNSELGLFEDIHVLKLR